MPELDGDGNHRVTRVTVWNEFVHERRDDSVRAIYPDGMHTVVGSALERFLGDTVSVRYATLDQPDHGLGGSVLEETDVLTWWGHCAHDQVSDAVVDRVVTNVLQGMGLVVMHSGHYSKVFKRLMGTGCGLRWRNENDRELVWSVNPGHPICKNVPNPIIIPRQEMYGEFFDIPQPDELVFISSFSGGEVFRSGCCFVRGRGRIFYFSPGDQEYPVYHDEGVGRVLANGVRWCTPSQRETDALSAPRAPLGWYESQEALRG
jgi:trehalose utilization protein